jgi:hypothetical protein
MAETKQARDWDHTATLACYIIKMNGDPKKVKSITPQSLHPYESKKRSPRASGLEINAGNIHILKRIFVDGFSTD